MACINKGSCSVDEVVDYIKTFSNNQNPELTVVKVNSAEFNNGTSVDYPHCHSINHPETGEKLFPRKGYMGMDESGRNDRCYYAEYYDNNGKSYYYSYQYPMYDVNTGREMAPRLDISKQLSKDKLELERNQFAENMTENNEINDVSSEKAMFEDMMGTQDENSDSEGQRKEFADFMDSEETFSENNENTNSENNSNNASHENTMNNNR